MLIPLIFKNNDTALEKTKIGKITPAQARMFYAYGLTGKVGIIKDYASECSITAAIDYVSNSGYARVTFNKGALSIYGGIVLIEQGTTFDIPLTDTATGSLGVKVDLSQAAGSEVSFYSKLTQSLTQQDLQANETDGVYEFEIYKFTVNTGVLTLGAKTTSSIITLESFVSSLQTQIDDFIANFTWRTLLWSGTATTTLSSENSAITVSISNLNFETGKTYQIIGKFGSSSYESSFVATIVWNGTFANGKKSANMINPAPVCHEFGQHKAMLTELRLSNSGANASIMFRSNDEAYTISGGALYYDGSVRRYASGTYATIEKIYEIQEV